MKKQINTLIVIVCLLVVSGCASLIDPAGHHAVQKAKWDAMNTSASAYNSKIENRLVGIDPATGFVTVYNQNQHAPIIIKEAPNGWVQGADVILNSTVAKIVGGGWAASYMLGKVQGNNYTASEGGSLSVSQDSGNSVSVETRHVEEGGSITDETHTNSDYATDDHSYIDDHRDMSTVDSRTNYDNPTTTIQEVTPIEP
jgi:outer membrane murein-binding lipoprotein Lpp